MSTDPRDYDRQLTYGRPSSPPPPVQDGPCPYGAAGQHDWAPDPDDPDVGDCCALCGVGR